MATGYTPGNGANIATDQIGSPSPPAAGDRIQYNKLDIGAAGSSSPVTLANPLPAAPAQQKSASFTLLSGATTNTTGSSVSPDGYNGAQQLLIANGAGTCTLTVQGSFDNFATSQNIFTVGVLKLCDSASGVVTARTVSSGAISVAANTSYVYAVQDIYPYLRAVTSSAAGLGAGTSLTGCTATLYALPS